MVSPQQQNLEQTFSLPFLLRRKMKWWRTIVYCCKKNHAAVMFFFFRKLDSWVENLLVSSFVLFLFFLSANN